MIVANPHLLRLSPLYRPNLTGYYLRVYVTLIYQLWRHGMIRIGARRTCSWYDKRWQFPAWQDKRAIFDVGGWLNQEPTLVFIN